MKYVTVLESENFPPAGVGLLWENNLSVDRVAGGAVSITGLAGYNAGSNGGGG